MFQYSTNAKASEFVAKIIRILFVIKAVRLCTPTHPLNIPTHPLNIPTHLLNTPTHPLKKHNNHGYLGPTETNLSRMNDPLMSLALGPTSGVPESFFFSFFFFFGEGEGQRGGGGQTVKWGGWGGIRGPWLN